MPARILPLIAAAAAVLHLADVALSSLAHSHGAAPCSQLRAANGCGCSGHAHGRRDGARPAESADPLAPYDHQQDCAACRHLSQAIGEVPTVGEREVSELTLAVAPRRPAIPLQMHLVAYRSRAPPRPGA